MRSPTLPPTEHRNLAPLPTPRASAWRILRTCARRVTLPIALARVDAQLEAAEREAWAVGRLRRLAEFDGNVRGADRLDEDGVKLVWMIRSLKLRQMELERDARG